MYSVRGALITGYAPEGFVDSYGLLNESSRPPFAKAITSDIRQRLCAIDILPEDASGDAYLGVRSRNGTGVVAAVYQDREVMMSVIRRLEAANLMLDTTMPEHIRSVEQARKYTNMFTWEEDINSVAYRLPNIPKLAEKHTPSKMLLLAGRLAVWKEALLVPNLRSTMTLMQGELLAEFAYSRATGWKKDTDPAVTASTSETRFMKEGLSIRRKETTQFMWHDRKAEMTVTSERPLLDFKLGMFSLPSLRLWMHFGKNATEKTSKKIGYFTSFHQFLSSNGTTKIGYKNPSGQHSDVYEPIKSDFSFVAHKRRKHM